MKTTAVAYTLYCGQPGPAHREGSAGVAEEVFVSVGLASGAVPVDPQADQTGASGNNLFGRDHANPEGGLTPVDGQADHAVIPSVELPGLLWPMMVIFGRGQTCDSGSR
ncbi:MAG TPA: hypothetical protein VGD15_11520 [Kribbella sp.]